MAKKKDTALESRVLTKVMSGAGFSVLADHSIVGGGDEWTTTAFTVAGTDHLLFLNIQKFDLSGYTLQDKTLFPQGVLFQDMNRGPAGSTPLNVQRCTVLSTTPLSVDNFNSVTDYFAWILPGMATSTFNLNNILSARYEDYVTLTTFAGVQQTKESFYGSGDSTAGEALWYADAYLIPLVSGSGANMYLPDAAVVIPTLIGKEPDLEYMMRLSRSLEPVY